MSESSVFSIGVLSRKTGCKVPTIRYYEQIGLLPEPARNSGNQRRYTEQHLLKLRFIRHARQLGFDLDAIRELLQLADQPDENCLQADRIAQRQLLTIGRKIAQLQALQLELSRMLSDCNHGEAGHCRVLETLANHSLCQGEHGES